MSERGRGEEEGQRFYWRFLGIGVCLPETGDLHLFIGYSTA